jgi:hypothetical protein
VAPARDTTADVITPSPRSRESFLRSDHKKNTPIAATKLAINTGANSRKSLLKGTGPTLDQFPTHLFAGNGLEIVNGGGNRSMHALGVMGRLTKSCRVQRLSSS